MLKHDFLGGVIEGFYGRPWTHAQRRHLLQDLHQLGLNTYFYAPKDDLKHRALWRELYTADELIQFQELASVAGPLGVRMVYGLSPGLDIRFAEPAECERILRRFEQLRDVGIRHFALLFDDLPGLLTEPNQRAFPSLAAAQCHVTNQVCRGLGASGPTGRFLFCPTPYCDEMDSQQLGGAGYLDEVGRLLDPDIEVLWTGPSIVSPEIPVPSIENLTSRLGRPPIVWDNLFANDYDLHRLHCGPYSGRDPELKTAVRGILINPNNEYPVNFIPLRTFARFLASHTSWQPRDEFLRAFAEWHLQFVSVRSPLSADDLLLLADAFYLPFQEGPRAQQLLSIIAELNRKPGSTWESNYQTFRELHQSVQQTFERLTEIQDRDLFHAWSRHGWQLKEELLVLDAIFYRKRIDSTTNRAERTASLAPNTFRGGMLAKLEQLTVGGA